jgi:molybdate transport system permease protein
VTGLTAEDWQAILLSLKVAAVATLAALPFAFLAALALVRGRFAGRVLLDSLVTLPLVLPPVATGYVLLLLFGRRGPIGAALEKAGIVFAFDWTGAALAAAIMAFPLMVRPIRVALEAIDREVDEAATTLGAARWVRLARITLPLTFPGLAAAAILGFAKALGEFGATITFVAAIPGETLTLPSAIYGAVQTPGAELRALMLCIAAAGLAVVAVVAADAVSRLALRVARGGR